MTETDPLCEPRPQSFYCYMVRCSNGAFYTGWTTDVARRVKAHNSGRGAAYTRMHSPVTLVYFETLESKPAAMAREREIKKYTHEKKLRMSNAQQSLSEIAVAGECGADTAACEQNFEG